MTAIFFLVAVAVLLLNQNALGDWLVLRGYNAPADIVQFERQDTMTNLAKKYFEINQPAVEGQKAFNDHCSKDNEQALVLGCFLGNRAGIYLYSVTDAQLYGVEQVTAAHELLHQAYQRLSGSEKKNVDAMLQNYYKNGLTDQAVKDQMALYQKTEPDAMVDEMHSVFGTEVVNLPSGLEQYYKKYFAKRSVITDFYAQYQQPFISRQKQVADDDAKLAAQKPQIAALETQLKTQLAALNAQYATMQGYASSGNTSAYNGQVASYNNAVESYNNGVAQLKQKIADYNNLVAERNALAVEENQLQQALSSHTLPPADGQ